jgi:DNA-binding MarR family transcriptional regulator
MAVTGDRPDAEPRHPGETQARQRTPGLGAALRRAWLGYQLRLDEGLAAEGFDGRGFPDGRILRICAANESGTTISQIGRELGITRQGASKAVASLRGRGYVTVTPSPTSGREKIVTLTPRAIDYLAALRKTRQAIQRQVQAELGSDTYAALGRLLEAFRADDDLRMSDYLRRMTRAGGLRHPDDWQPPTRHPAPQQPNTEIPPPASKS